MEDLKAQPDATSPAEPSEYEAFKDGLRQIMSVPKAEIDRREAEWQKSKAQKPARKKKAV